MEDSTVNGKQKAPTLSQLLSRGSSKAGERDHAGETLRQRERGAHLPTEKL